MPDQAKVPKIKVVVRKRPRSTKEISKNDTDIISVRGDQTLIVSELKQKVDLTKYIEEHIFNFDQIFDDSTSNEQMYKECVKPLVEQFFLGTKVTCFAYGQTGSGKTYTMLGDIETKIAGLYLLASDDIFQTLDKEEN